MEVEAVGKILEKAKNQLLLCNWIHVIPMEGAQNSDQFTFLSLEIPPLVQKLKAITVIWFCPKMTDSVFKNKCNIINLAKNYPF